ncbi:MAG: aldo/keto reductase [Oscillospiraceae bacterium]|nr:aldo/keto reductase [Oscillospiraceae bacterium]
MTNHELKKLGNSEVMIPEIGVGLASWGERHLGYGTTHSEEDIYQAYRTSLDNGLNFFDTAPGYGGGESECLLGKCFRKDGRPIVISTKYAPPNMFEPSIKPRKPCEMLESLDKSLQRLGVEQVDLFTLHFPPSKRLLDEYMDIFVKAIKSGKTRAVGVSNFSESMLRMAHKRLADQGIPLASIQSGYSILQRNPEENGVLKSCRELKVSLIATGPLAQGVLTGKHRSGQVPLSRFQRTIAQLSRIDWFGEMEGNGSFFKRLFTRPRSLNKQKLEPLFAVLEDVAKIHEKTIAQVAVNWLLTTDPLVVPIPGAKNMRQASENAGAVGWRLSQEEYQRINQAEIESR